MRMQSRLLGDDVQAVLFLLRDSAVNRILRPAVSAAITPALRLIKSISPFETGTFKRAAGRKVKTYAKAVVGLAGIRTRMGQVVVRRSGWTKGRSQFRDPGKFGHIIEKTGAKPHLIMARRNGRAFVVRHPGIRPRHAIAAGTAGVMGTMKSIFTAKVADGVGKFTRRSL